MTAEPAGRSSSPLASNSVRGHLLRGVAGLVVGALAVYLMAILGPVSLVLLILTAVAWRGCPTCWTVGLISTIADVGTRRACSRCPEEAPTQHPRSGSD
jgi:hypothetical protein